jgi:hypothetical protein
MPTWKTASRWWVGWGESQAKRDAAEAWLNTVDPIRVTRRFDNVDPKTNQRVPAPNPHATSVVPTRALKTTLINEATAGLENGKTTPVGKTTKRL